MYQARLLLVAALSFAAWPAPATNIVVNPGFEDGAANWQSLRFSIGWDANWAHDSRGQARTACAGAACLDFGAGAYLRQMLPTVAGEQYDVGFWVRSYNGVAEYALYWDGVRVDDSIVPNGPMLHVAYTNLAASGAATMLEIHGRNDPSVISFDDFTVIRSALPLATAKPDYTSVGMVPEPLNIVMLAAGLTLLGVTLLGRR